MDLSRKHPVRGYKATNKDGRCRPSGVDSQLYKVGKEYNLAHPEQLKMCWWGFHFCRRLYEVFDFYPRTDETRVFLVEARGDTIIRRRSEIKTGKCVTDRLYVVRELTRDEILEKLKKEALSFGVPEVYRARAIGVYVSLLRAYGKPELVDEFKAERNRRFDQWLSKMVRKDR